MKARAISTGVIGVVTLVAATGCGGSTSGGASPTPTPSPTAIESVKVLANPKNCDAQPLIVTAGKITFTATSTADIPISVSLFAPQDGAFTKRLARIRVLKPSETQTMAADLTQGAYEIACGTEVLESRKRITAI